MLINRMSVITPESINIASLPSLALNDKKNLPSVSAIYLVLEGETIIYIGLAKNLYSRWRNYHQKMKHLRTRKTSLKIAWLECSDSDLMPAIEKALIAYFHPELNGKKTAEEIDYIQVVISKEDKADFNAWCEANYTTMSEMVRRAIAPYVVKGGELRKQEVAS